MTVNSQEMNVVNKQINVMQERKDARSSSASAHLVILKTTTTTDQEVMYKITDSPIHEQQRSTLHTSSINDYMIKLIMFLVAVFCSQSIYFCDGQKHHFHPNQNQYHASTSPLDEHLGYSNHQRQALDQLIRNTNYNQHPRSQKHNYHLHHYRGQRAEQSYQPVEQYHTPVAGRAQLQTADRRASNGGSSIQPNPSLNSQQQQPIPMPSPSSIPMLGQLSENGSGKLLVCYYTTKQSPPYWPQDTRGYVIPSEMIQPAPSSRADHHQLHHAESGFSPILQYEPFAQTSSALPSNNNNQHQSVLLNTESGAESSGANVKNQQQQLVFKSAIAAKHPNSQYLLPSQHLYQQQQQHQHSPSHHLHSASTSSKNNLAKSVQNNNNGFKSKQYGEVFSQMLVDEHLHNNNNNHLHHLQNSNQNNPLVSQQQSSITSASSAISKDNVGKQHQTNAMLIQPAYSLVGSSMESALDEIGGNNGLIVGGPLSTGNVPEGSSISNALASGPPISSPGTVSASLNLASQSGNNGQNSFVISTSGSNNKQQLYSSSSSNSIHSSLGSIDTNNSPSMTLPMLFQSHPDRFNAAMKQTQSDQQLVLSQSLSRPLIVGTSSSSSLSGLSSLGGIGTGNGIGNGSNGINNEVLDTKSQLFIPSSIGQSGEQLRNLYYHTQQQQQPNSPLHLHEQPPALKGKSMQLQANDQHPLQHLHHQHQQQLAPPANGNQFIGTVSNAPPVPLSVASSHRQQQHQFSPLSMNQLILPSAHTVQSSQTQGLTAGISSLKSPSLANLKSHPVFGSDSRETLVGGKQTASSGSSTSSASDTEASNHLPGSSSGSSQLSTSGLSTALASSPFSTMFDVFGAASQYLMRFKPSSLISPSTLVFNTITSDNHHHHSPKQKPASNSSSLFSGPSSLIPLPFSSSSILANIQKSTSSSLNERMSKNGSMDAGSNMLSRFSLQNNQHREDVCGRTIQTPQRRIIGGEGARYGEFPYQVHIKIAKHQCGGALVDKQSIVTAAHCVYHFITRAPVSKLQIVIGAYDIEDEQYQELPPQYFKVNKVKLHPNFRFSASHPDRYDIAILKLDKPVKYTDNVLPVCLPSKDLKFENMVGTVTGFGKTDPSLSNRYGTRLLQKVDVPIIENNECERWHRTRGIDLKIFPEMMCAGYEDGLKDACVGDSGGPLVVKTSAGPNGAFRWTLAGITSAGFGCAQSRQPGIYHRVSNTVDWILENLD